MQLDATSNGKGEWKIHTRGGAVKSYVGRVLQVLGLGWAIVTGQEWRESSAKQTKRRTAIRRKQFRVFIVASYFSVFSSSGSIGASSPPENSCFIFFFVVGLGNQKG